MPSCDGGWSFLGRKDNNKIRSKPLNHHLRQKLHLFKPYFIVKSVKKKEKSNKQRKTLTNKHKKTLTHTHTNERQQHAKTKTATDTHEQTDTATHTDK